MQGSASRVPISAEKVAASWPMSLREVREVLQGKRKQSKIPVCTRAADSDTFKRSKHGILIGYSPKVMWDNWIQCPYASVKWRLTAMAGNFHYEPNKVLYVREPWSLSEDKYDFIVEYQADGSSRRIFKRALTPYQCICCENWQRYSNGKALHAASMPMWASRLFLPVTQIRVAQMKEHVSEEDAVRENMPRATPDYIAAWNMKYPRRPWVADDWVWVVSYDTVIVS